VERSFYALLIRQRNELLKEAEQARTSGDVRTQLEAGTRARYLVSLRKAIEVVDQPWPGHKVFISYSKATGQAYFEIAAKIAGEFGFEVVTGFDRPQSENVLGAVKEVLNTASVFLGIMTPEYSIRPLNNETAAKTAPSVWVIEEKGMALALEKPFRLLVEESVHADFWRRTTPERLHHMFTPHDFRDKADHALRALYGRLDDQFLSSVPGSRSGGQDIFE